MGDERRYEVGFGGAIWCQRRGYVFTLVTGCFLVISYFWFSVSLIYSFFNFWIYIYIYIFFLLPDYKLMVSSDKPWIEWYSKWIKCTHFGVCTGKWHGENIL